MSREAVANTVNATGSRSLLRRMNCLGMLRELMTQPRSLSALAGASGLSRTAVDAVIADLVDLGWVETADREGPVGPGRPATVFRIRSECGHLASIDIGANHVYAIVTDLVGRELAHAQGRLEEPMPVDERLAASFGVLDAALRQAGIGRDDLWVIAVGSPGAISSSGVVTFFGGDGMPGWVGLDLRAAFAAEYDAAIIVEGDVPLGAHAELARGAARGLRDVVYILCGVRTSSASIVDGRVHRGVHGAAGIVGELPQLRWLELNELYGLDVLPDPRPSRERIFELARAGDPAAQAATDEFADFLATGASAMVLALDPELVVIGGGSSPAADVFLPRFTRTLASLCPVPPRVVASTLGSEAVAIGGLRLAADLVDATLQSAVQTAAEFPEPAATAALLREAGRP
jgi:predicted NBD/HSP70 family sugar kinase